MNITELLKLFRLANQIFHPPSQTKRWFKSKNGNLGWKTPIELIKEGKEEEVRGYLLAEIFYR